MNRLLSIVVRMALAAILLGSAAIRMRAQEPPKPEPAKPDAAKQEPAKKEDDEEEAIPLPRNRRRLCRQE